MIQDQLVEYINSQMKTGVSRDTIKSTLITAGWQATDVEDTLAKVESTSSSQPITAMPSSLGASPVSVAAVSSSKPASQTIKMSDLIATSDPATMSTSNNSQKVFAVSGPKPIEAKPGATSYSAKDFSPSPKTSHGALITEIVLGILVVAIGALAGYLYFQNNTLNSQVAKLNSQSSGNSSQLATLQQNVAASTTAWTAQLATANGQNKELQTELSFYAVPAGNSGTATSSATLSGMITGGDKVPYLITATYGAKIYISNSKAANVIAALQPLEASSTTATFTGTYLPGADSLTLTAVNGTALQ
jgi:hypothetical protein